MIQNLLKWKVFFGVFLVCLFSSVVGFHFLESLNSISSESADLNQWVDSILKTTPVFLKTDSHLPSFGPIDAPITIVEFSDYQCPYCRVAAFRLNTIMQRYSGKIRVIFKNYPLDQACNKHWAVTKHPAACEASRISYCAHLQGKFQEVYEELFEKQSQIVSGHVLPLLTPLGFSFEKIQEIQKCSGDLETTKIINEEIEEATLLGVQGTPTFFINGHKIEGLYPILVWNKIIEYLLL
jgi:protein-disulfide isomerase